MPIDATKSAYLTLEYNLELGADVSLFKVESDKKELTAGTTEEYDVVIVGSGASGMSAAIELAKEDNLKVLVLEKLAYPGGSSRVCGGGIWAIGDSIINKNVEVDYTADEYIEFMETLGEAPLNRELMTWANLNSTVKYGEGYGGKEMMDSIFEIAKENGAEVRLNSKVTSLVVEDGTVKGVNVEDLDSKYTVDAKKVILATGGFTRNTDLIKELAPDYASVFAFTGAGSTGDGLTMTKELDTVIVGEASKLDVDADVMIQTVKENGLEKAPYYAMEVRPLFIGSIPGLKVTEDTEVVNSKGEVIPNLYAVGELIFGNTFNKYYPSSGTGMGTSVYTGAIAAKHIVEQLAE